MFFTIPSVGLPYYLGFFAGFLLYIGASDILPQAHSNKSTAFTLTLTVLGVVFAFVVSRFVRAVTIVAKPRTLRGSIVRVP